MIKQVITYSGSDNPLTIKFPKIRGNKKKISLKIMSLRVDSVQSNLLPF